MQENRIYIFKEKESVRFREKKKNLGKSFRSKKSRSQAQSMICWLCMWTALSCHQHSLNTTCPHRKGLSLSHLMYSSIHYDTCHITQFFKINETSLKNTEICELSCCDLRNTAINLHCISQFISVHCSNGLFLKEKELPPASTRKFLSTPTVGDLS